MTDFMFLLPGDICIYNKDKLEERECMIVGSYATNCDVHMNSRAMVQGGLTNNHFHKYKVMWNDNSTMAWIDRSELTFVERKGLDYYMRRLYRSQLDYTEVTDKDIIGDMTLAQYLKVVEENDVTLLFNPPIGNELLYVTIKEVDEETGKCTVMDTKGETYTDIPFGALYINMVQSKIEDHLTCCEKQCPIAEVPFNGH